MNITKEANTDWKNWKQFLGQAVEFAEELGVPKTQISSLACQAGNILAENVPPTNPEQEVLKELWQAADNQERQILANLMTKLSTKQDLNTLE